MRAGRLIRQSAALDTRGAQPCGGCGHPLSTHRELPREFYALRGDDVLVTSNPEYRPLLFGCDHDGCGCRLDMSA